MTDNNTSMPHAAFTTLWLNVNGINSDKPASSFSLLLTSFYKSPYSILFLQEPRLKEAKAGELDSMCNWPNSKVVAHFTSNERGNGGVATIIKKTFLETLDNFLVHEVHPDECQHITFAFQGTQCSYANVHMSQHGAERGALCIKMAGELPIGTIVGGDFNMVQDPDEDTYRPHSTRPYDNGGWQEMMAMQVSLQLQDLWRETKGDSRLYTHISSTHTGTTKTRIDYVLCPHGATVGPYGLATDHDYTFWQGTGRADHLGVTLTVQPVEMTPPKSKRHAISPHIFETHGWNELHNSLWEAHILKATEFTSVWQWWEEWKATLSTAAKCHTATLDLKRSKQQKDAEVASRLAHKFAALNPGEAGHSALQGAKRAVDQLHETLAYQSKKARLTYGIQIASHMHPAFLSQAKEAHARAAMPSLDTYDSYFDAPSTPLPPARFGPQGPTSSTPTATGQATTDAEKLQECNKFYQGLYQYESPDHTDLEKVMEALGDKKLTTP